MAKRTPAVAPSSSSSPHHHSHPPPAPAPAHDHEHKHEQEQEREASPPRITRSAARAAAQADTPASLPPPPVPTASAHSVPRRKRVAKSPLPESGEGGSSSAPARKRQRRSVKHQAKMADEQALDPLASGSTGASASSSKKKSTRSRKSEQGTKTEKAAVADGLDVDPTAEGTAKTTPSTRTRRGQAKEEAQAAHQGPSTPPVGSRHHKHHRHHRPDEDEDDDDEDEDEVDEDDEDNEDEDQDADMDHTTDTDALGDGMPHSFLSRLGGPGGFPAMRAFGGLMGMGTSSRFKDMLDNLRTDDPSVQMVALQELSNFLLISTEDNLTGHFVPDQFVRELVKLMQPHEITAEENPEMMLLACRCLANLMEALPPATASVVYGGAVPVLCQKLLEIHYIDVAEQALSTLEKISVDFPASIVREGGLGACLNFLDFFATGTQRTAVTTAANCCRNIPEDSFSVVRDAMPVLLNVLGSTDQKVVEQGSLCVSRIAESFKHKHKNLEELFSPDLLRAILRLLMPGTTNLIPTDIHTKFVRVLAIVARASPTRSAALLEMDVVDTLYQILTGVSPPSTAEVASHIDGVVIMQSLIRKQREQIYETLNVICEVLPGLNLDTALQNMALTASYNTVEAIAKADLQPKAEDVKRRELLNRHGEKLERFASILLPTLTHAYTSTVNLGVRQKVLAAQLKMLSNLDVKILENALRAVPFASHLASILSQKDHALLALLALTAAQLLSKRLGHIYDYQFCREGVIAEITKLANRTLHDAKQPSRTTLEDSSTYVPAVMPQSDGNDDGGDHSDDIGHNDGGIGDDDDDDDEDEDDEDEDDPDPDRLVHEDMSPSPSESSGSEPTIRAPTDSLQLEDIITLEAKKFIDSFNKGGDGRARTEANAVLENVRAIANSLLECYNTEDFAKGPTHFRNLAKYFGGDALQSITSAELLGSDLVDVLLDTFTSMDDTGLASKTAFLSVFMDDKAQGAYGVTGTAGASSPFTALVQKLQDLLSRAEHFEVITVHNNSYDNNRSSATSMLAKQLRLKLIADDGSDIPRAYRNIMVSIHAIATFKALDDYLRPRLSLSEGRIRGSRHTADMLSNLAAAASGMPPEARQRLLDSGLLGSGPPPPIPPIGNTDAASKSRRRSGRQASAAQPNDVPATPLAAQTESTMSGRKAPRRRRKSSSGGVDTATQLTDALECADERKLSDGDEDENEDRALLAPPLGTLGAAAAASTEERPETPDPSAVNMEIASTGKVTARQEDGTRIPTPSQNTLGLPQPATGTPSAPRTRPTPTTATASSAAQRAMNYAAALTSTPQDWHIEFSINGQPINNETTIYRAVHYQQNQPTEPAPRSLWSAVHPISFKRVPGPPPEPSSLSPTPDSGNAQTGGALPQSLHKNPLTSKILRLLAILHEMNTDIDSVIDDQKVVVKARSEPTSLFVNTKLTAKLNRQLEEPLVVASNCLPGWSEDLARLYPFLFPFETRHLFLQSTSFGYSRSMSRWQSTQSETTRRDRHRDERPFLGRLQRQKVRISRSRILESAMKVMELYGASPSVLEVEYFEEVGTGLGPTLEFYSTVSKEFSKKKLKLWRDSDSGSGSNGEFAFGKNGLFPTPMSDEQPEDDNGRRVLHLFRMMGKFVARAMLDSRIIDISFNPMFFKFNDDAGANPLGLAAIKSIDAGLYSSLKTLKTYVTQKKRIEDDHRLTPAQKIAKLERVEVQGATVSDLGFDFTLPGYPQIELIKDGSNIPVSIYNVDDYLNKIVDYSVNRGVRRQIASFRAGFSEVFPYSALRAFTPAELVMLFGRVDEDWSMETLTDSIKADHGYNMDSESVKNLLQAMSELDVPQQRDFLQFITGSPKLPIGGFKSLTPMFTVVCKPSEPPLTSDDYLPSVMTCVNYLKLPNYSSIEIMKSRLFTAIREGQGAFHLS